MPDTLSPDFARALSLAAIPEHSPAFMRAMSGGEAFFIDDFLFLRGKDLPGSQHADWLMAVGYRLGLAPGDDLDANARDFSAALDKALESRDAKYRSIEGRATVETGIDDKGRGRVVGMTLDVTVHMDEEYEFIFDRVAKIMRQGCLITGSLEGAFPVKYNLELDCDEE